jgi:hypothetical protein
MHDAWLLRLAPHAGVDDAVLVAFADACAGLLRRAPERVRVHRAVASSLVHAYFELAHAVMIGDDERAGFERDARSLASFADTKIGVDRLTRKLRPPAASAGEPASHCYVVETAAAPGWDGELARWYDSEHMPGLAAVPGCVRAQRFVNVDAGPWSHACYDLVSAETTSSPEWLAVRATAWSDRVRPQFRDTRRTMFRSLR